MKLNSKRVVLISILLVSLNLVGCNSIYNKISKKYSDVEVVATTVLNDSELVSIKEIELNKDDKNSKKDLVISLNLPHSSQSVALDNALLKCTRIMNVLEDTFKEKLNDYTFIINTNNFDIYGNEQKMKILEIKIENDTVDKINFENFNYKNLEQLSTIKKFNYLEEKENTEETANGENEVLENNEDSLNTESTEEKLNVE